jgi:hypothetical protein
VSDAERRLVITRLLLVTFLGFTLSLAKAYMKAKREVDSREVISDVELFLKATRLQDLVLPEHQTIINEIGSEWSNDCYRGAWKAISVEQWVRQQTDTLSP